jgi:predicted nucleotidyltransferase
VLPAANDAVETMLVGSYAKELWKSTLSDNNAGRRTKDIPEELWGQLQFSRSTW